VDGADQTIIELQQRFTARKDDKPSVWSVAPRLRNGCCQISRGLEFPAAFAIDPDEIRIAKLANRIVAVLLAAGPQIAAGETAENCGAAGLRAFSLQGFEKLFYRIGH
jgi:hypothetical protein